MQKGASIVSQSVTVSVSDLAEIGSLHDRLLQVSDVQVTRTAGTPGTGELGGTVDIITAIGSSSGLVALIRTIPPFLRARRSGISVHTTVKGRDFTLTVDNVDDVMPIIERLLDE
jgi:Effector Associated Constant Component 1